MRASDVLNGIGRSAPAEGLPIIGPDNGATLDGLIRKRRPVRALEIGTIVGCSAIRIARLLPRGGSLTCVEQIPELAAKARANLEEAGLTKRSEVLVGGSKEVMWRLQGTVDFVLVDARKDEYLEYLHSCEHLLHTGSVIVADDVKAYADQVADYLDSVRNSRKFSSRTFEAPFNADDSVKDAMDVSVRL